MEFAAFYQQVSLENRHFFFAVAAFLTSFKSEYLRYLVYRLNT